MAEWPGEAERGTLIASKQQNKSVQCKVFAAILLSAIIVVVKGLEPRWC